MSELKVKNAALVVEPPKCKAGQIFAAKKEKVVNSHGEYNDRQILYVTEFRMASKLSGCIEFPHFGARYPDAACIEGYLWDLDSGDSDGLTKGGEDPCPCCNTRAYINDMLDNEVGVNRIHAHLQFIFSRYSRAGEGVSNKLN